MLNEYIWKLYLTAGGNETVKLFHDSLTDKIDEGYADAVKRMQEAYCINADTINETYGELQYVIKDIRAGREENQEEGIDAAAGGPECFEPSDAETDRIFGEWYNDWLKEKGGSEKEVFTWFTGVASYISTLFAVCFPGLFIPYYYYADYDVLAEIAGAFDIDLPGLPGEEDWRGRVWHYAELCKALARFEKKNRLSFFELCAFLYDFAPKYIRGRK